MGHVTTMHLRNAPYFLLPTKRQHSCIAGALDLSWHKQLRHRYSTLRGKEEGDAADETCKAYMLHASTLLLLVCRLSSLAFARLLVCKHGMNVGQDTARCDRHSCQEPAQRCCSVHALTPCGSMVSSAIPTAACWSHLLSSSSFRTASCMCLGLMRAFLLSLAALPESSRTCSITMACSGL